MFAQNNGYDLSDIAAVTNGNGRNGSGFMGDDGWWIILLFLFGFGNGGWGGNGNRGGSEISYSFDMNGLENGIRGIQQGLCDGFYAVNTGMLNGFSGVQSALCQGFSGVAAGMTQNTTDIIQSINADTIAGMQNTTAINANITGLGTQLAQCCCDMRYQTEKGFSDLGYALATQACDTRRAIADSTKDILDFLTQDKIATLTAENQSLKFAASQQAQNAFIAANQDAQTAELIRRLGLDRGVCPIPAYVVPNPNCCYGYTSPRTGCGDGYCG